MSAVTHFSMQFVTQRRSPSSCTAAEMASKVDVRPGTVSCEPTTRPPILQPARTAQQHPNSRNTTQHHATPRNTTQHHATPRNTTQHHATPRNTTQHHAAPHYTALYQPTNLPPPPHTHTHTHSIASPPHATPPLPPPQRPTRSKLSRPHKHTPLCGAHTLRRGVNSVAVWSSTVMRMRGMAAGTSASIF